MAIPATSEELREFGTGLLEHLDRHGSRTDDRARDVAAAKMTAELLFALFRESGAGSAATAPAQLVAAAA